MVKEVKLNIGDLVYPHRYDSVIYYYPRNDGNIGARAGLFQGKEMLQVIDLRKSYVLLHSYTTNQKGWVVTINLRKRVK